jgi:hypothetical protein
MSILVLDSIILYDGQSKVEELYLDSSLLDKR